MEILAEKTLEFDPSRLICPIFMFKICKNLKSEWTAPVPVKKK